MLVLDHDMGLDQEEEPCMKQMDKNEKQRILGVLEARHWPLLLLLEYGVPVQRCMVFRVQQRELLYDPLVGIRNNL